MCARCVDRGVLGPVPGVIGTLQALEALKLIAQVGDPLSQRLLIFSALEPRATVVRLRSRRPECAGCGDTGALRACGGPARYDYAAFTGGQAMIEAAAALQLLSPERRVTPEELHALLLRSAGSEPPLLVDVRPAVQFSAAHINGALNVPYANVRCFCPSFFPPWTSASGLNNMRNALNHGSMPSKWPKLHGTCYGTTGVVLPCRAAAAFRRCRRPSKPPVAQRPLSCVVRAMTRR
jgi:rhodanese-related sulfurtransferase